MNVARIQYDSFRPFKPAILHFGPLGTLLLWTLALLGLVEYACRILPHTNSDGSFLDKLDDITTSVHERRDHGGKYSNIAIRPQEIIKTIIITNHYGTTSQVQASDLGATIIAARGVTTFAPNPNVYLNTRSTSSDPPQSTTPQTAPNPNAYLQKDYRISSGGDYFLGAYLPTVLAILFGLPWVFINRTARSLEPFHQLSRPQGASAESTLTANFQALLAPLRSIYYGQWTVIVSTVLTLLGTLITPLAPEAVAIRLEGQCSATTVGCTGRLSISTPVARTVQALLAVMALLTVVLTAMMLRRRSMILSDPRSIAGLGLLFLNPYTRNDFAHFHSFPTDPELKTTLQGSTYRLASETFPGGITSTGLERVTDGSSSPLVQHGKHGYSTLTWDRKLVPTHQSSSACFFVFLLALASLILAYHYTSGGNGFEKFMDSQEFGVRFLFTPIGVLISFYWRHVFEEISLLAPYRALVSGNATARSSILFTTPTHPLLAIHSAISSHHYVLALVAFAAILSEVLTITLSTIPFSSANLFYAYMVSTWICVAIIVIMLGVLGVLFFRKEPKLPVKPETLAAQLVYISESPVPGVFRDLVVLDTKGVRERIEGMGYRYRLDMCQTQSGTSRLMVDFER